MPKPIFDLILRQISQKFRLMMNYHKSKFIAVIGEATH